jgi:hypothetical protein
LKSCRRDIHYPSPSGMRRSLAPSYLPHQVGGARAVEAAPDCDWITLEWFVLTNSFRVLDRNRPTMWLPSIKVALTSERGQALTGQLIGGLSQQSPELGEALFESGGYSGRDIFSNGPHSCQVRSTGRSAPYDPYAQHTSYSPYSPYSQYPLTTAAPYVGPKGGAPFGGAGITYTGPLPT